MRKLVVLLFVLSMAGGIAQQTVIDYIAPFHEGLAAVKKGDSWGFVNTSGDLVVNYRTDLVTLESKSGIQYPRFESGRALIFKVQEGIRHFGYIDMMGSVVIEPNYINAGSFYQGHAIVLKVNKQTLGRNEVLGKDVVSYSFNEVVIDPDGEVVTFLRGPINLQYDKEYLKDSPPIKSKFVHDKLVATQQEDSGWELHSLENRM